MTVTEPDPDPDPTPALHRCLDRRTVVRGAGALAAGLVGAASLSSCGGASSGKPTRQEAKPADVPVGGGRVYARSRVVVTQPVQDQYKAFSAECTHQGCLVTHVADGTIDCPCHGSKFDITTGATVQGPATTPLPPLPLTVSAGSIVVDPQGPSSPA